MKNQTSALVPTFVKKDEFKIAGLECRAIMKENEDQQELGQLWGAFMGMLPKIENKKNENVTYGLSFDFDQQTGEYSYVSGVEIDDSNISLPDKVVVKTIPASRYAVFTYKGDMSGVGAAFKYIYETWLPQSGEVPAADFSFEIYDERFLGPENENSETEIYIPLK
ncbi:GyrI-like domain-containing protein [Chengkuizengella axinellae]|uniref:GyrI-like domain-containing protein n=1 Tax=Chengkuizengella axinellae TaxID=3064388 RepID=A0ABT9J288_9BACL|nr:GyrI-like domain-containing protein [Chengkuizengella sp. 2205SS18-9]MDP5275736.1 GyrI-like domain-containing protein [Chengkuizengella sp. 2205SS18-9]